MPELILETTLLLVSSITGFYIYLITYILVILTNEEVNLAAQFTGKTRLDVLMQNYLSEAQSTKSFMRQVVCCREILNILDQKVKPFKKRDSITYKLCCDIIHNPLSFRAEHPVKSGMWEVKKGRLLMKQSSIKRLKFRKLNGKKVKKLNKKSNCGSSQESNSK
ncbi:hypothetical protein DAPPUDRAFT_340633 [Daphnia pulex]|uniref:Uncharacterized protein n=1 Tax=Daphnia pulex TaxID=6669 RepID=E9I4H0_DAPPU|nr:hypothetical protein DAPPUDRAFT_340633 [Daphnia pulex]|eukprot:EFX61110.1 hypothetical protein DAPPUDRAFT_340633 [Daphnia pulex]